MIRTRYCKGCRTWKARADFPMHGGYNRRERYGRVEAMFCHACDRKTPRA